MPPQIILRDKPSIVPILVVWPLSGLIAACPLLYIASTLKGFPILNDIAGWIALLFIGLTTIRLLTDLVNRQLTLYALTDTYLTKQSGIFNRNQTRIPLSRVQGAQIQWPLAGQILDYGNIVIPTAGHAYIKLYNVPHPQIWEREILDRTP